MEKERETAIKILSEFEEVLREHNILIPDEDRTGKENEACLYGVTYYNLEDKITDILKSYFKNKLLTNDEKIDIERAFDLLINQECDQVDYSELMNKLGVYKRD